MTILKDGDLDHIIQVVLKTRRFECEQCGCEFEANKDEYKVVSQYNEISYFCKCPCCGATAYEA